MFRLAIPFTLYRYDLNLMVEHCLEAEGRAKMERKADKNLTWKDDDVALIFSVILDYKTAKSNQGLDWETIQAFAVIVFSSEFPFLQNLIT